jgi:hypothetical protein
MFLRIDFVGLRVYLRYANSSANTQQENCDKSGRISSEFEGFSNSEVLKSRVSPVRFWPYPLKIATKVA